MAYQASVPSTVPGGLQFRQETVVSRDGHKMQVKMAPVFASAPATQTNLKLDFIPGAD
jgi:hypothetical protein